jgi:CBS domain-containing protein
MREKRFGMAATPRARRVKSTNRATHGRLIAGAIVPLAWRPVQDFSRRPGKVPLSQRAMARIGAIVWRYRVCSAKSRGDPENLRADSQTGLCAYGLQWLATKSEPASSVKRERKGRIMTVGEMCNRAAIVVKPDATVVDAMRLMKSYHVGDLVVVEDRKDARVPIGIVTDRDIALCIADKAARLPSLRIADVMSHNLITSTDDESLAEALRKMRSFGIRRLPIVNAEGTLQGIVTFDDVVELLSEELTDLARLVASEQKRELVQKRVG